MARNVMTALLAATGCLGAVQAQAAEPMIKTETVEYKDGAAVLKGYLAYDESAKGRRPGVLVFSEWTGLNDYAKSRARQLAELGYVALAADVYGDGKVAKDATEAGALAGQFRKDRALMRSRAAAALATLKANPMVDPARTAAIGYCFGGTVVLELARSGADLAGVVSFHGGLDTPTPADAKNIKCKVLVCHGAIDPHVDANQVAAFQKEMTDAGVDWQMIYYGGAVHSFTNPASGSDLSKGVAYNEKADRRSWQAMKDFFWQIFSQPVASGQGGEEPVHSGSALHRAGRATERGMSAAGRGVETGFRAAGHGLRAAFDWLGGDSGRSSPPAHQRRAATTQPAE